MRIRTAGRSGQIAGIANAEDVKKNLDSGGMYPCPTARKKWRWMMSRKIVVDIGCPNCKGKELLGYYVKCLTCGLWLPAELKQSVPADKVLVLIDASEKLIDVLYDQVSFAHEMRTFDELRDEILKELEAGK